jgi:multidrug efflux pump subunit AcrA (membrane-fusion protein)
MRFLRNSLIGVFLLSVTVGLFALAADIVHGALQARWAQEAPEPPARERIVAANVVTVAPTTVTPVLETFGELRSRRTLELRAATGGAVIWVAPAFEEGGRVAEGEALLRIDPADAQSALDTARAEVAEAEADLRDAERGLALARDELVAAEAQGALRDRALDRQRDLEGRGVGSASAVETAELASSAAIQVILSRRQALAQAETRLDQAGPALERRRIALAEAERRLSDTEIAAEFAGVLSDVSVVAGGLVSPNERIAEIVDPDALEVVFRVSTSQYARLLDEAGRLVGLPVTVALDVMGADMRTSGTISRESAAVGEGQTGRVIYAQVNAPAGFRPGDFVRVLVEEDPLEGVAVLPAAAVSPAGQVLVVGEDERLAEAPVEVLRRQGDSVIVRAADLHGREVVAERTPLLGAGIRVRPVRPAPEGETQAAAEPEMVELDPERRARLVAFVAGNAFMPPDAKERVLGQLQQDRVPAQMIARIESRMGG